MSQLLFCVTVEYRKTLWEDWLYSLGSNKPRDIRTTAGLGSLSSPNRRGFFSSCSERQRFKEGELVLTRAEARHQGQKYSGKHWKTGLSRHSTIGFQASGFTYREVTRYTAPLGVLTIHFMGRRVKGDIYSMVGWHQLPTT